ncbi:MAG: hypothetical protein ACOCQD_03725 [archaeon]
MDEYEYIRLKFEKEDLEEILRNLPKDKILERMETSVSLENVETKLKNMENKK